MCSMARSNYLRITRVTQLRAIHASFEFEFKVLSMSCFLGHDGLQGTGLRTVTGLSMPTPPIDIIQRGSSNPTRRIDLRRAQHANNMPHGPLAPCAPSTA